MGLLKVAALALGCGGVAPDAFRLPLSGGVEALPDGAPEFDSAVEFRSVTVGQERRRAVASSGGWTWQGRIPRDGHLLFGVQALPEFWSAMESFELRIRVERGDELEILDQAHWNKPRWLDMEVDLSRYGGREVTLTATIEARHKASATESGAVSFAWSPLVLASRRGGAGERGAEDAPPNILLIVIDTLRADHLTSYGYHRDTAPSIDQVLAKPGTVVETAYAQAPWTLPSVASFMTGRYPGEILGESMASFGIPETVPSLAEGLAKLGYRTAAFVANPTVHEGNGFGRGFETFYTPPPVNDSMLLHAEDVADRAVPWLKAYQRERPFFVYAHFLDPHDPYDNPDLVDGRSPWYPDYRGSASGKWVHGIYTGKLPLENPEDDVAHLTALYDSEIAYVDRAVGRLIDTLDPAVLSETLIVLTSDHGEELYDHGGWKHGQSLYQHQIRVPLIVRWDGRVAAGERLVGNAQLVDLMPTLLAAAGGEVAADADGIDLLPALAGEEPLPRRVAYAQNHSSGPVRAAVMADGQKLVRFDRAKPFEAVDELQDLLWKKDVERLERTELYDLGADPGEQRDLSAARPAEAAPLITAVDRQLGRQSGGGGGWWLVSGPAADGEALQAVLEVEAEADGEIIWQGHFLGPDDRVRVERNEASGDRLILELAAGPLGSRGVRLSGIAEVLSVSLGDRSSKGVFAAGVPWRPGGATSAAEGVWWPVPEEARLALWKAPEREVAAAPKESDETRERLKALGYL